MTKKYQIIYADPAWEYDTKECLAKTSILDGENNKHYSTLTMAELKKLDVQSISDKNCLLFIWVVSPMLDEGIEVLKAWGFKYATIAFIWHKQKTNPGHYTMSECEICLVGKRGSIPTPRGERNIRQFLSMGRGKNSEKPPEIRKRIEAMFPTQDKVELFARRREGFWPMDDYIGWDVWGNQIESNVEIYNVKPKNDMQCGFVTNPQVDQHKKIEYGI